MNVTYFNRSEKVVPAFPILFRHFLKACQAQPNKHPKQYVSYYTYIPLNPIKSHWITIIYPIKTPFFIYFPMVFPMVLGPKPPIRNLSRNGWVTFSASLILHSLEACQAPLIEASAWLLNSWRDERRLDCCGVGPGCWRWIFLWCIYIYIYVCMYVCVHACMHVCFLKWGDPQVTMVVLILSHGHPWRQDDLELPH